MNHAPRRVRTKQLLDRPHKLRRAFRGIVDDQQATILYRAGR